MPECISLFAAGKARNQQNLHLYIIHRYATMHTSFQHFVVNLRIYSSLEAFNTRMYILVGYWKSTEVDKVRFFLPRIRVI
jgi:hypothetical protein